MCLVLTGCGKKSEQVVLDKFNDLVMNSDAYYLSGNMELVNNEDVYTYDISVSYKKDDFYKIELVNVINNHRQIILRNEEGVYIVTPSLNKSFKFQSDWPYNNSQVYLLSSLLDDIKNDEERKFETTDSGYVFTSMVNYPNNEKLVSQKVYFDKDYLPTKVEVIDTDGLFISIGSVPSADIFDVEKDKGFIIVDDECMTNIENVYACGDVIKKSVYQLTTAASEGTIVAYSIIKKNKK